MSEMDEAEYNSLTVVRLRELCKERGLKVGGKKQDIIHRLTEYDDGVNNDDGGVDSVMEAEEAGLSTEQPVNNNISDDESAGDDSAAEENNDDVDIHNLNDDEKSPTAPNKIDPPPDSESRSGVAEDAELLAELKAISDKSSCGRFQDDEDIAHNNNIVEEEQRDENCVGDNDAAVHNADDFDAHDQGGIVTDADENGGGDDFDEDEFDDDAFLPNATIDVEDEEQFVLDNDIVVDECVQEEQQLDDEADLPLEESDAAEQLEDANNIHDGNVADGDNQDTNDNIVAVEEEDVEQPIVVESMGIKSSLPNTFNGKNGGIAEDADLLAELRAISSKASGNRFDDENDNNATKAEEVAIKDTSDAASTLPVEQEEKSLPPWKQKKTSTKTSSTFDVDVVVASAPAPPAAVTIDPFENAMRDQKNEPTAFPTPNHQVTTENFGIKSSLPNTFNGKNGGAAEDADLLAELRAISNKTSGSRFDDVDESSCTEVKAEETAPTTEIPNDPVAPPHVEGKKSTSSKPLPRWKQKRATAKETPINVFDVDIVVAAAPTPTTVQKESNDEPDTAPEQQQASVGIKSNLPNTFKGTNGGVAEDADLLAELRAISNKNSASRFDDGEDESDAQAASVKEEEEIGSDKLSVTLPPLRHKNIELNATTSSVIDVAAAPAPATSDPFQNAFVREEISEMPSEVISQPPNDEHFGIKSSLPSTFNGENGGTAEDADLLAELRAISKKASGGRFDDRDVDANAQSSISEAPETKIAVVKDPSIGTGVKKSESSKASGHLPPWKQKGAALKNKVSSTAFDVDIVVAEPPAPPPSQSSRDQINKSTACVSDETLKEANVGIKLSPPNTFSGKNGGIAEDADLLAELRAISNKSSGDRFNAEDDVDNEQSSIIEASTTKAETVMTDEKKSNDHLSCKPLPPWKQKRAAVKKQPESEFDMDVVVVAPPAPAIVDQFENAGDESFITAADEKEIDESNNTKNVIFEKTVVEQPIVVENMGIKSSLPNTFNGKNGGIAEDADLLAELRAISNKASGNRFDGGEEQDDAQSFTIATQPVETKAKRETADSVPHWKRKNAASIDAPSAAFEVDVVVTKPALTTVDNDENENVENSSKAKVFAVDDKPWKKKTKERSSASVPPWKVKREKKNSVDKSHSESMPDPFQNALLEETNSNNTRPSSAPSHVVEHAPKSTFSGKNGGAAEDADLLAELKAISGKSSNRFVDPDDVAAAAVSESPVETKNVEESRSLPSLKQKVHLKKADNIEVDVVVSTQPKHEQKVENMGIKSSLPSTFKGKNGGAAEDADLLAELRAISMKTSSNRFDHSGDDEAESSGCDQPAEHPPMNKPWLKNKPSKKNDSRPLPPWKQKGAKTNASAFSETNITIAAPPAPSNDATAITLSSEQKEELMGIKSEFTNTFNGDRGGAAEDADLLAELRAVSKNSSSDRFADTDELKGNQNSQDVMQKVEPKPTVVSQPTPTVRTTLPKSATGDLSAMNPFPNTVDASAMEINITLDGLDESLASSNWQIRKASYQFLQEKILTALSGHEPENQLRGGDIYPSLDGAITKALGDKNAGALDFALALSVTYSDCCEGACSEDTVAQIMSLLLKGAAFASPRPSTQKTTQELVLKLVEVAPEGSMTADNVIDLIQQHGLKAKKPKVVNFAATLVLLLIREFGTSVFNVSKLSAVHEVLVANSNDKIRAIGIDVLAELCRTFGSKSPMQAVVDKLKKSQQSQLDALLDKQPTATLPTRRLRCKRGVKITTQSPEEALAALKKNEEEEKLKRFASRPAINLLQVLPQTCYKEKIKEAKWSEKVGALDALIEAGGEQPYKICDGNYTSLLRELKQLLGHTHYLVCSKALAAIGMLAEGVGEPISSDLRTLLPTIVPLFKDKKVGKAVMSCLDQMFGNALRFDHFLDNNNLFLTSLDEKKEKNALVRKSVLEFLARCVVSSGTRGTCGTLTAQHTQDLCKVACDKLKDSDATTRKAATDVLIALLTSKDEAVVSTAKKITSSLESSNARAFKTLALATKSGKPDAGRNGASRPGTAPLKATSSQPNKPAVSKARPITAPKPKSSNGPPAPTKNTPSSGTADETTDESTLPSLDESIESLSGIGIPQWGDEADNGGVLAGIQSSNWKQRMAALNSLTAFYQKNGDSEFSSITYLFVLVKTCTKSFQESNFNVAKAILELFTALFNIHAERKTAPETFLYVPIIKLAAEKIGDRKLTASCSSCLDAVCVVKDPQRVLHVATKAIDGVKSPLVHDALLVWIESFSVNFGLAALSNGVKDLVVWILKECENNNMKVKNAARNVLSELYNQLGPVLESFVKSSDVSSSVSTVVEKVIKDNTYDPNANQAERKLKCITMSSSNGPRGGSGKDGSASSMLALPTTDLMAALKSDCLDRMNDTGDKKSWRNRKEALDEVAAALDKCGGLLSTEGKAFLQLKQLATNLRLRTNDSQSNLKPLAASVIGSLLSHLDDTAQAKLGAVVFPALVNAAMNDMKKTMRDAAISALVVGTDSPRQNGGGTNASSVEAFILALESELSDASLKSSGLPDVLSFLTAKLESLISTSESEKSSVHRPLAKVIVLSLLSSKAGSRSAAENLLAVCSKNAFVPSSSFDKEIGKLLPAQQRTVRSFIPKLSKQDQELVDTFKKASERPRRPQQITTSRQTTQVRGPSNKSTIQSLRAEKHLGKSSMIETDISQDNPLQMSSARSVKPKAQRLAMLGKGDSWPEYAEDPSGESIQALRKLWALIIPSTSIDVLFPQKGLRTHDDCISGCDLISKAIGYSRQSNDLSFLEMLDLIFKWATCAILLRDHTSGFRKLLSMILDLFRRLEEISYVLSDDEALLLLPYLLDKAGVAKLQFKEEILSIFTLVTTKKVYPSQKFGPVCMKVLEKSKSNPSRPLAAELCLTAVHSAGVPAIGRKGLVSLSNALNEEKVTEIRKVYVDLFEVVVQKLNGDTDKLFSAIKPSDKVKAMILERCGNHPVASNGSPKRTLTSPSSKIAPPVNQYPTTIGQEAPILSSSAVATGNLRARFQKSKESKLSNESSRLPPIDTTEVLNTPPPRNPTPRQTSTEKKYDGIMIDINYMTKEDGIKAEDVVRCTDAIKSLHTILSNEDCTLDSVQKDAFLEKVESDYNTCVLTVASALNFAFNREGKSASFPVTLINEVVLALQFLLRMPCCRSEMKQKTVEYLVNTLVSALLDDRIHVVSDTMRSTNKTAMRAVLAPSLDHSLNALISVQASIIDPKEGDVAGLKYRSKFSRVIEKLLKKVTKDRNDSRPSNPFGELEELGALLASIDWMIEKINLVSQKGGPEELVAPSSSMIQHLLLELVRCKRGEVRETVEDLGDDVRFIEPYLRRCEEELGLLPARRVVMPSSTGESSFRERLEALKRQRESSGK